MEYTEYYQWFVKGDDTALEQLVRAFRDGLMLYLNTYVRDLVVAEELTEETFVKLILKKPKFSGDAAFKTWLYSIGRNIAIDYLRKNKVRELSLNDGPEILDDEIDLERNYIKQEERILVHRTVKKLKPEYQQILWLIYFENFSNKEAGRILGKTPHNVETLVYRARKALKTKLLEGGYVYENL